MRDRLGLGFSVGVKSRLCFVRGIEIKCVRAEVNLFEVL